MNNLESSREELVYPEEFANWDQLSQSQYLESTIFLPQYLLSSQGDRVAMAHAVEGRYPFLDHRVVEFCCHLPPDLRLNGLTEKYLLRQLARKWLPGEIWTRPKRPYRAPIHRCFFHPEGTPDYVRDLLSSDMLEASGLFNIQSVQQLVKKLEAGRRLGETDDMALAGILSSQLVWQQFVSQFDHLKPRRIEERELTKEYSSIGEKTT